jgi:4-hydroxy-tetrahydrodipicolinate reductase
MIRTIICGAAGRMGRELLSVFLNDEGIRIVHAIESPVSRYIGQDAGLFAGMDTVGVKISADLEGVIGECDAVVDFSNPKATLSHLESASRHGKPVVIGTTGFSKDETAAIQGYAANMPVVLSPNMSQGVNVLFHLVKRAAELLGEDFDIEINEVHHNLKKDAPSGTALQFGRIIAETRKKDLAEIAVYGRQGMIGQRKKGEIGIMAMRVADVVGEHTVVFGGPGERIEFTHKASSRKTFASGALRAVKYIQGKTNGLYTMRDVLGLS